MAIQIGEKISHYRIIEKLGEGGMGIVYKAEDTKLKRTVALKFLPSHLLTNEEEKTRFLHEARAASALDHPNICTVYEIDETDDDRMFISMGCYDGETVKEKIKRESMNPDEAVDLAIQVAQGLATAHEGGIVHRDIKPGNIMVTTDGLAKLVDFGLAKLAGEARITKVGTTVGTVAYMSPEQAQGEEVDHLTDIWSFGVVLYEMLTGQLPFKGDYEQAVIYSILNEDPQPVSDSHIRMGTAFNTIINKCLAKSRDERCQKMNEVLTDLRNLKRTFESGEVKRQTAEDITPISVAVLPFEDLSPRKDQEYFCDGMAEELINALTGVKRLRVASRTSAFQFKGKAQDVRKIGENLNVSAVLEGSVRKAGKKLRITAQLVDARDGLHLWSESYEGKTTDVFAVQDKIAGAIVDRLKTELPGRLGTPLVKSHAKNLEAYNLYLKGRYHWNKRTEGSLRRSIQWFEKALERDPDYAPAYAGLADSYITLGIYSSLSPNEAMIKAEKAAQKALAIDNTSAEAHCSLGCFKSVYTWDWSGAEREFRRAIESNPSYAMAHHWYAINLLTPLGRFDEAAFQSERACKLDPLSLVINLSVGLQFYFQGQHDKAVDQYRKTLEMDPNFGVAHFFLGQAYNQESRYKEATVEIERAIELYGGSTKWLKIMGEHRAARDKGQKAKETLADLKKFIPHFGNVTSSYRSSTNMLAMLGYSFAVAGRSRRSRKVLQELIELSRRRYVSAYDIAAIYTGLGEKDAAFDWLEKALEERSYLLIYLKIDPVLDTVRSDPRFAGLLEAVGLSQ
ncbi:MAG: protein kinase [Candidatus Neomarinimicrobiota bacterium]